MAAHSYWRLNVTASNGGANLTIDEVEFRGSIGGADQCSGGTPSASSTLGGNVAANAFDNTVNTAWQATTTTGTLQYLFASAVEVAEYTIRIRGAGYEAYTNQAPKDWTLQWSDNGSSWTTVDTQTSQTAWSAGETRTLAVHPIIGTIVGDGGAVAGGEATIGSHNVMYGVLGAGGAVAGGEATVGFHNVKYTVVGSGGAVAGGQATFGNSDPQYDYITGFLAAVPTATTSGLITPPGYVFDTLEITGELTSPVSAVAGEMNLYLLSGALTTQESSVSGTIQLQYNLSGAVSSFVSGVSGSMLRGNALSGELDTPVATVSGSLGMGAVLFAGALKQLVSIVSGTISDRTISATPEGICLVINTTNLARSEYTNFIPDSIIEFGGSYYGAFPDGIYLLEGTDDAGTAIVTEMQTGQSDLGVDTTKYVPDLYIAGKYDEVTVTTIIDNETEAAEKTEYGNGALERRRVKLPRGSVSHYWGIRLTGATQVDSLELGLIPTSRRISR